ncbi:uncharacterized protein LOC121734089 [Aricia agestis]|uniref:uncharacterized protein LOC121734089 n=1 Tax=Aricia agestis TaxID=91739 RepID=UPI001C20B8D0|nr:uncharacterized protein LOC121734089 [Aricia agestis]
MWTIKPTFIFYLVTVLLFTCSNIVYGIIEMGNNIKLTFTLSTILLFTNIRFKALFLVWIICFQGEVLKNTDLKIKTLLTEISLGIDDFNPEKRVATKFLRYLEKNRNKLRMWRIINIELRLSWLCFMKLFDFTLLVIQLAQMF